MIDFKNAEQNSLHYLFASWTHQCTVQGRQGVEEVEF